ncbi:MAG: hypothetical protein U0V70_05665 [Terriglobia bacterium]
MAQQQTLIDKLIIERKVEPKNCDSEFRLPRWKSLRSLPSPASASANASRPKNNVVASKDDKPVEDAPLQFRIGSAYITPVGFLDFTGVWRSKTGGSGIGTNFASIPYGNIFQANLSEFRLTMQNSPGPASALTPWLKGAHVMGYMESDFLGNNPGNVAVSSNVTCAFAVILGRS